VSVYRFRQEHCGDKMRMMAYHKFFKNIHSWLGIISLLVTISSIHMIDGAANGMVYTFLFFSTCFFYFGFILVFKVAILIPISPSINTFFLKT